MPKKLGAWCPYGDYHALNDITTPDRYPIPHTQDFRASLHGATIFSKVDLVLTFNPIPVHKDGIPKTAIITPFGLYEYLMMPYGLWNAAQTFQYFMDQVCQELSFFSVYIDDILIASHTPKEYVHHLQILFTCLSQLGFVINPDKCQFGVFILYFLGYCISSAGIAPLEDHVEALSSSPAPSSETSLPEYLVLINFTIAFICTVQKSFTHCTSSSKERTLLRSGHPHVKLHSSKAKRHYRHLLSWHTLVLQHLRQSSLMPQMFLLVLCWNKNFMANGQ